MANQILTLPSAWGEEYMYKIGNKDVRFYIYNGYVIKCQIISE